MSAIEDEEAVFGRLRMNRVRREWAWVSSAMAWYEVELAGVAVGMCCLAARSGGGAISIFSSDATCETRRR